VSLLLLSTWIEILVKKQWSIKVLDIKEELHRKASEVKWHPEWMEGRIHSWIDGLNWDWCISRQRFFGVPIPVWYSKKAGEEGEPIMPSINQLPVDPTTDLPEGCSADEVYGESDVFDTWFTSSVSPQLSIWGVTEEMCYNKKRFNDLKLPFSLRPQGHDIIRTWAFCTLVKAYYHENIVPWTDIMVNGFCLAEDGTKMSKSVGNVIDPIKVIDEFGTDAVRYWTSNSTLGTDTSFSKDIMKAGQKLVTKLWNCAKFGEMHFKSVASGQWPVASEISDIPVVDNKVTTSYLLNQGGSPKALVKGGIIYETMDLWILSRLGRAIDLASKSFEKFEYAKARDAVEDFFWNDFCDNYLEIVKIRCYGIVGRKYEGVELSDDERAEIKRGQMSGVYAIYHCLNTILKLFAPFVPHIAEEIFSCLFEYEFMNHGSIHARGTWPKIEDSVKDFEAEKIGEVVVRVVADVRRYKSDNSLAMNAEIAKIEVSTTYPDKVLKIVEDLKNVTSAKDLTIINGNFGVKILQ
jgi:valyl-tRNA synthetase